MVSEQFSDWSCNGIRSASETFCCHLPGGLVVRIRRFHRRGRGSIPRLGIIFLSEPKSINHLIQKKKKKGQCIGRESNPGRPRGRRAFYHWTTDADITADHNQFWEQIQKT